MHVCIHTYLNAFLMAIPNIVTKFQNVNILLTFLTCRLLMPTALKVLRDLLHMAGHK